MLHIIFGVAYLIWSAALFATGLHYMRNIAALTSGILPQIYVYLMIFLVFAVGAVMLAGLYELFYAASHKVRHFRKYLASLFAALMAHLCLFLFTTAIGSGDVIVYSVVSGILAFVLLCEAITHAICYRRDRHAQETSDQQAA